MSVRGYLLLLGALVGALVLAEAFRPRPLDVRVRLEREGDAPFDAEVFFASLPEWLGQPVETVAEPAFERLGDSTLSGLTYFFLSESFAPDEAEADRILRFAAAGNPVFVAAHEVGGPFGVALGVRDSTFDGEPTGLIAAYEHFGFDAPQQALQADELHLVTPGADSLYRFPVAVFRSALYGIDPDRTELIGVRRPSPDAPGRLISETLVRVQYGKGEVIVSSTPLAFSNAALTGDGDAAAYVGAVLDALPQQPVLWDDYNKPYQARAQTPLRYVLQTPPLRWAYLLLILAGLLYVAFRGRRWQRAVPVVAPPPNAQREFARTVGRLHFVHRDEARLARRMRRVFLDRIRTTLRIAEPDLSPDTARLAAVRAGVPEDEALGLFATLNRVAKEARPDPDTLVRLDARVADFFRHTV